MSGAVMPHLRRQALDTSDDVRDEPVAILVVGKAFLDKPGQEAELREHSLACRRDRAERRASMGISSAYRSAASSSVAWVSLIQATIALRRARARAAGWNRRRCTRLLPLLQRRP